MPRNARQSKILEVIAQKDIETQEELACELKLQGFCVTQATISRDIKDLCLVKTPTNNNKYKYVANKIIANDTTSKCINIKSLNLLKDTILSIVTANNLIVVKTLSNSASAVSSVIDNLELEGVIGVVGNGDCLLIVTIDNTSALDVANSLNKLIS